MDRKTFIKKVTGAMLISIPFYSILSCSDDPAADVLENNCLLNGTVGTVGANHGHSITVSKADVAAGIEKQYNIQGSSEHDHIVTVSESNFASLKTNRQIQTTSTTSVSHNHIITISCA